MTEDRADDRQLALPHFAPPEASERERCPLCNRYMIAVIPFGGGAKKYDHGGGVFCIDDPQAGFASKLNSKAANKNSHVGQQVEALYAHCEECKARFDPVADEKLCRTCAYHRGNK